MLRVFIGQRSTDKSYEEERRNKMLKKEVAVQLMEHLVNHDWHGYSQVSRWGDGEGKCIVNIDGMPFELEQGDRDCSSAIISAFESAGISCGGATYTGNMRSCMTSTGNFIWHPMASGYIAQRGDIYLNEANHTALCTSAVPDLLAEFCVSENETIDGVEGDQTGQESYIHDYYDYPWDGILQCVNTESYNTIGEGWKQDNIGWWYRFSNGTYAKNQWLKLADVWYWFDSRGYASQNEWKYIDGSSYYFNDDCKMVIGWTKVNDLWYFMNNGVMINRPIGAMLTGWVNIDEDWYYFRKRNDGSPIGSMVTNQWLYENGSYYYLDESGKWEKTND